MDVSGETLRLRTIGPFTLRENAYAGGMALPRHSHPHAYITFVTEGAFRESYGTHSLVCRSGTIRYLPPAEFHENEILSPSRCLHITSHPFSFEELRQRPAVPRRPVGMSRLTTTRLANCLYAEFSREGSASATAIEGMVLELLAGIARTEAVDSSPQPPPWLKQAIEQAYDEARPDRQRYAVHRADAAEVHRSLAGLQHRPGVRGRDGLAGRRHGVPVGRSRY